MYHWYFPNWHSLDSIQAYNHVIKRKGFAVWCKSKLAFYNSTGPDMPRTSPCIMTWTLDLSNSMSQVSWKRALATQLPPGSNCLPSQKQISSTSTSKSLVSPSARALQLERVACSSHQWRNSVVSNGKPPCATVWHQYDEFGFPFQGMRRTWNMPNKPQWRPNHLLLGAPTIRHAWAVIIVWMTSKIVSRLLRTEFGLAVIEKDCTVREGCSATVRDSRTSCNSPTMILYPGLFSLLYTDVVADQVWALSPASSSETTFRGVD